jgi:hypothetical protein
MSSKSWTIAECGENNAIHGLNPTYKNAERERGPWGMVQMALFYPVLLTLSGWWFQTFFIFQYIWGNPSH